jgi:polysaccharide export outer membrane protein
MVRLNARSRTSFEQPIMKLFLMVSLWALSVVCLAENTSISTDQKPKSVSVSSDYRIGSGDVLDISVWKEEGLMKDVLVRPDGGISFPLIGDLHAAGKTVDEVTDEIIQKLSNYLSDPVVTVAFKQINHKVFVLGKVNKPGEYLALGKVDVMQALAMAGGLTPFADEDDIIIIHHQNDKTISLSFDYNAVSKGEDLQQNITLERGDVVIVR